MPVLKVSPENMGPFRHKPGGVLLDIKAVRASCLGLRGSFAVMPLVRSPIFPAIAAVIASAVVRGVA